MKYAFLVCGVVFALMYVGAQATLQKPKSDGVVHLRWATDPNPARQVQLELFDRMYPGVDCAVDPSAGGDISKVLVQSATGTGPDLIDAQAEQMQSLVAAGILLDLTPYAKSMGFDAARTYPAIRDTLGVGGRQYRFPRNVWANCIIYNKAIFDDHGVPYPKPDWTQADFVRTSKLLLTNPSESGEKHLAIANWSSTAAYQDMLIGHGGRVFSPDGLHSALAESPSVEALEEHDRMMYGDKIIPTPGDAATMSSQGGWGSGGLNWFAEGKAAMISIGRWYIIQVPNFPNLKGHLGAVLLPRIGDRPSAGACGAGAVGINVKSPHWRESLKFLQYLASAPYGKIIVDDGDSLPPNPALATTGAALSDEFVPDPAFHQPFVEAIQNARPLDMSPFVDSVETGRWMGEAVDKVENKLATPKQALRSLATQIDRQIRLNLERDPGLQKLYTQRTGKPYRADWE